jgi:hypothetical protein
VLGPSIRVCCYDVGEEVREAFQRGFLHAHRFFRQVSEPAASHPRRRSLSSLSVPTPGHDPASATPIHLDLVAVAQDQLLTAGLTPHRVAAVDFCTACRTDLFYSHRREGSRTGRMLAVIGIYPAPSRRS